MGASRSGSTILNALLGAASNSVAVGELSQLARGGWLNDEYCACGARVSRCEFWQGVLSELGGDRLEIARETLHAQQSVERLRFFYRGVLFPNGPQQIAFRRNCHTLVSTIASTSGVSSVIDASKNPLRARAMARIGEIDFRLVHLVRDVRGVAWSLAKPYRKDVAAGIQNDMSGIPLSRGAASWALANTVSELVMKAVDADKRIRIRYEDLVNDPVATLRNIEAVTALSLGKAIERVQTSEPVSFGHTVAGNRARMGNGVTIQTGEEWHTKMPADQQRRLRLLVLPWARRYGYE